MKHSVIDSSMQVELVAQQEMHEKGRLNAAKCLLQHLLKSSEEQCSAFLRCLESCKKQNDLLRSMRYSDDSVLLPEASSAAQHQDPTANPSE